MFVFFSFSGILPLTCRRHYYRLRTAKFGLYSANMVIQWAGRLFRLPYLLWHGTYLNMVLIEDPWHSHHACWVYSNWAVATWFNDLSLPGLGDQHLFFRMRFGEHNTENKTLKNTFVSTWCNSQSVLSKWIRVVPKTIFDIWIQSSRGQIDASYVK